MQFYQVGLEKMFSPNSKFSSKAQISGLKIPHSILTNENVDVCYSIRTPQLSNQILV